MLILFIVLVAAPLIVRNLKIIPQFKDFPLDLMQPIDQDNNDTTSGYTGNNLPGGMKADSTGAASSGAAKMFVF